MRRCVVFLLIFLLLLPGCAGRQAAALEPNRDGTLGKLRWGMTPEEAAKADSRVRFSPKAAEDGSVPEDREFVTEEVRFLDHTAALKLFFHRYRQEGENAPLRLYQITLWFRCGEGDPDCTLLLTQALGEKNLREVYDAPRWDRDGNFRFHRARELPEIEQGWRSEETLSDRVSWEAVEAAYPTLTEEQLAERYYGDPLFRITVQSYDPETFTSTGSGERQFGYLAQGRYLVLAELLEGRLP